MNINIKFILILLFLIMTLSLKLRAQDFYIIGGLNVSKLRQIKDESVIKPERSITPSFQIGALIDFPLNEYFSFMPSLQLAMKRERLKSTLFIPSELAGGIGDDILEFRTEGLIKEFGIDIPCLFKLKYRFDDNEVYCLLGPFIGYRILDKSKTLIHFDGSMSELHLLHPDNKIMENLDYGFSLGVGFLRNKYLVQFSYDNGFYRNLKYRINGDLFTQSIRNNVLKINLGYCLK